MANKRKTNAALHISEQKEQKERNKPEHSLAFTVKRNFVSMEVARISKNSHSNVA